MAYTATSYIPTSYSIDWTGMADQGSTAFAFAALGGTINSIAIPASAAAGTYNGTMTIVNANGCTGTKTVSVIINAVPTLTGASQPAICSGSAATINLSGLRPGTTSTISYSINGTAQTPVTGVIADALGAASFSTPVLTYANNGQTLQITGITITSATPNCSAAFTQNVTLVVRPIPTLGGASQSSVCSGSAATINLTGLLAGSTSTIAYSINGIAQTPVNNIIANGAGNASFTTPVLTSANNGQILQITGITVTSAIPNCSAVFNRNVTLSVETALLPGSVGSDQSKCDPANPDAFTQLTPASGGLAPLTYQWKSSTTSGGPYTNIGSANGTTYDAPAGLSLTTYYVRTVTSAGVCGSVNSNEIKVTVNPSKTSEVKPLTGPSSTCKNSTITMTYQNVTNADQYVWDYSWTGPGIDATTALPSININLTGIAIGSYTIKVAGINGCNVPADYPWSLEHNLNINDIPDLSPLGATVCSDAVNAITLSITNSGAYCSGITYNITNIADGGLLSSAGSPATGTGFAANVISNDAWTNKTAANVNVVYTVVPVSLQNCSGTPEDITVVINPEPDLNNLNKTVCSDDATGITLSDVHGLANRFEIVSITPQAGLVTTAGNASTGPGQLANAIFNDKWTNKTATLKTVTYAIIPRINGGCIGDQENVVVTVNPEPDLKLLSSTVCSDAITGITLSDEHGLADRFEIVSITPQAGLATTAGNATTGTGKLANAILNDKWTNKTASALTVTYAIIPRINAGCIGDQENVVVTVNPEPDLKLLNSNVCSDAITGITLSDEYGLADRFEIVSITPQAGLATTAGNATTGTGKLANAILNDKWTNKTASSLTVTYAIIPRINGGCIGDQENVIVTVNPEPDLKLLSSDVCSDAITGITLSDEYGLADRFEIVSITPQAGLTTTAGNSTTGTGKLANAILNDKWTNKTATALTVTYAIIPRINGGCIGDQENVIITVNPEPDLKDLNKTVCSTVATGITLSDVHSLADRFEIVSITPQAGLTGDPGNSTTGPLQLAGAIANDKWTNLTASALKVIYTVIPRINGGCIGDPENVEVTISPEPDLSNLSTTVCNNVAIGVILSDVLGLADQFNILSISAQTGLTPGAGNVTAGNAKPANYISSDKWINTTTGNLTVTYEVVPSIGGICYGKPENVIITIRPAVIPGSITGNTAICYNTNAPVISNAILASGGDGNISYSWYYTENMAAVPGDASWTLINGETGSSYDPGFLTNPTKFVRKATDGSCPDQVYSGMITININPLPVTSVISGPSVLCEDATNRIYQVVNTPGSTYAWTVPASIDNTMAPGLDNLYFIIVDAVPGMATPTDTIYVTETITSTGCVGKPVKFPVNVVDIVSRRCCIRTDKLMSWAIRLFTLYLITLGQHIHGVFLPGAYIISEPNSHSIEVTFKMAVTGDVSVIENSNGVCNTIHTPVTVTVNPLPTIFNLTAPLAYCAVNQNVTLSLSGSQAGVNYQLYNSLGADGAPLPGTGSAITWSE